MIFVYMESSLSLASEQKLTCSVPDLRIRFKKSREDIVVLTSEGALDKVAESEPGCQVHVRPIGPIIGLEST
ncbi:Uncharacterized protein TCM_027191 [Theobroma cacao]|uniref:Uncharacterized protein n=1 Tax=Theobroma cacao TaxID=3641 RepID=A0A061G8S1_THECC|nr:Uncharacterized protein TCM_027191 [Theobroma cacao]